MDFASLVEGDLRASLRWPKRVRLIRLATLQLFSSVSEIHFGIAAPFPTPS
jgi:hypothetical protein